MTRMAQQPVRLIDVAQKAGVSRVLVGHVLLGSGTNISASPQTVQRILKAAELLNYRPNQIARQLKGVRSNQLAVLMHAPPNELDLMLLLELEAQAHQRGLRVVMGQIHHDDDKSLDDYLTSFSQQQIQTVFFIGTPPSSAPKKLAQLGSVIYTLANENASACRVEVDRKQVTALAVKHLASRGRKRIALLINRLDNYASQQRLLGYQKAVDELGLPKDLYICPDCVDFLQEATIGQTIDELLKQTRADAVITTSDIAGVWVVKYLKKRGLRVPEDVAVVGSGNHKVGLALDPTLTTIDFRPQESARAMLDMSATLAMDGTLTKSQRHVKIEPQLIERESS